MGLGVSTKKRGFYDNSFRVKIVCTPPCKNHKQKVGSEFVIGGGAQPSTEPVHVGGLDGSAAAEERDNYHRDAYTNDRNHASGAPRPGCE